MSKANHSSIEHIANSVYFPREQQRAIAAILAEAMHDAEISRNQALLMVDTFIDILFAHSQVKPTGFERFFSTGPGKEVIENLQ